MSNGVHKLKGRDPTGPKPSAPYSSKVLLQLLDSLQSSRLRLGVLQQCPDIKHVVQVGLDLDLQPVALRMLQSLRRRNLQLIG